MKGYHIGPPMFYIYKREYRDNGRVVTVTDRIDGN